MSAKHPLGCSSRCVTDGVGEDRRIPPQNGKGEKAELSDKFASKTKTSRYTKNKVLFSVPCSYAHEELFVTLSSPNLTQVFGALHGHQGA